VPLRSALSRFAAGQTEFVYDDVYDDDHDPNLGPTR
jgi:hypothetical protein